MRHLSGRRALVGRLFVALLAGLQLSACSDWQDDTVREQTPCLRERLGLDRQERRSGFLLTERIENIRLGQIYSRRELVARYRLARSGFMRTPTPSEIERASELIIERSHGRTDPLERIRATRCLLVRILPEEPLRPETDNDSADVR